MTSIVAQEDAGADGARLHRSTSTITLTRHADGSVSSSGDECCRRGLQTVAEGTSAKNGSWLRWVWNGNELEIACDRFGLYPAFFAQSDRKTVISTSLRETVRLSGSEEWNDEAMAVFLRLGYFIGNDTPFQGVHRLPAGLSVRAPAGLLPVFPDAEQALCVTAREMSRDELLEAYAVSFDEVVNSWVTVANRDSVVPLSGGRDSRHILLSLARVGAPRKAVTARHFAPKPDEDQRVARLLASATATPHTVLEQPASIFKAESAKNIRLDCTTTEHAWFDVVARWVEDHEQTSAVWDGIAGDVLSAGHFLDKTRLSQFRRGEWEEFARGFLGDDLAALSTMHPSLRKRWSLDRAISRIVREARRYAACPNPVGQFFLWNRSRRGAAMACWGMMPPSAPVIAPFLDERSTDLLEPIPAELFPEYQLHSDLVRFRYPEFAGLPFEDKNAPSRIDPPRERDLARRSLQPSLKALLDGRRSATNAGFALPRAALGLVSSKLARRYGWVYQRTLLVDQLVAMKNEATGSRAQA